MSPAVEMETAETGQFGQVPMPAAPQHTIQSYRMAQTDDRHIPVDQTAATLAYLQFLSGCHAQRQLQRGGAERGRRREIGRQGSEPF